MLRAQGLEVGTLAGYSQAAPVDPRTLIIGFGNLRERDIPRLAQLLLSAQQQEGGPS